MKWRRLPEGGWVWVYERDDTSVPLALPIDHWQRRSTETRNVSFDENLEASARLQGIRQRCSVRRQTRQDLADMVTCAIFQGQNKGGIVRTLASGSRADQIVEMAFSYSEVIDLSVEAFCRIAGVLGWEKLVEEYLRLLPSDA